MGEYLYATLKCVLLFIHTFNTMLITDKKASGMYSQEQVQM